MNNYNILEVRNLKKYFPIKRGLLQNVIGYKKAVDGISFNIRQGETFGLVGESGSGKSTTALSILRGFDPTEGEVFFKKENNEIVDLATLNIERLRKIRTEIQIIFQDPYSSLNPRLSIKEIIGDPLYANDICKEKEIEDRVGNLLEQVGLKADYMSRYPHAFSGGQRQRIGIARALSVEPRFVACDEPVSALDVSVQAQILNLLNRIQDEFDLTYLFIAHDLSVIRHICDRVGVMYVGNIVEFTETEKLFDFPLHPYTESLLSAVPKTDPDRKRSRIILEGEPPDPANPPSGCHFHPRCRYSKNICRKKIPEFADQDNKGEYPHQVACHFAGDLNLKGVKEKA